MTTNLHDKMLTAIDAYFSASNEIEAHIAEEQLLDVRDEINKYKLAAESLNEGLRLDDWDKIGCVNHDCDQCKAQQDIPDLIAGALGVSRGTAYDMMREALAEASAQSTADKSELETVPAKGGLLPEQQERWAVFCGLCFKEWSVPYQHPGKSVCENCEITHGITKGNT